MSSTIASLNAALEGRYQVEREIGEGGMATVFLAKDLKHNRNVALKVLKPELAEVVGAERFLTEIETTASLQHPHILPLFDSGEADRFLFYVMPFIDGESLRDRLDREGQLPIDEALAFAREVADGLAHAHEAGVIHRDIKPANILLSGNHAAVADFGIARGLETAGGTQLTQTGVAIGTPTYMSPEQAAADDRVDGRSDVYSLACVLYEMLAGEAPYTGQTPVAILAKKVTGTAPDVRVLRDSVPPWIEAVLARALAKSPADRFPSARAFGSALAGPASSPSVRGGDRTVRPVLARVAVATAVVSLVVAGAWGIRGVGERGPAVGDPDPEAIVVLPFVVRGGEEFSYLREGMVDLLSTKLDGVGGLRLVDPQAMLASLRDKSADEVSLADISRITERLGAGRVIQGTVLPSGGQLLIRASVRDAEGGSVIEANAEGTEDDLFGVVDQLVSQLVAAGVTGQDVQFANLEDLTTQSNEALRSYLDGVRNFRQGRGTQESLEPLRRAVALDSTFALAAIWAGYVAQYQGAPGASDFLQLASRHRERLSPRAQMRLQAALAGAEGRRAEQIELYRRLVDRYPDDVAGWFQLGEQIAHSGDRVGEPAGAARPAYERAIGLDPALSPVYFHLAVIGGLQADTAALDAWAAVLDSVGSDPVWSALLRAARAGLSGDTALLDRSVDISLADETNWSAALVGGSTAEVAGGVMVTDPEATLRWMDRWAQRSVSDTLRAIITRSRARVESALGRLDRAEATLREVGLSGPARFPYDMAEIALHPAASGGDRARRAEHLLEDLAPTSASGAAIRRYLLARLALKLGDPDRFLTEYEALRQQSSQGGRLERNLVLELAARDAQRLGEPARGLDSLLTSEYWIRSTPMGATLADRRLQFLRAELLEQAGRPSDAALWYQIASEREWYRVIGLERLGELAEEAQDTARARVLHADVQRLWAGADPEVGAREGAPRPVGPG